MQALWTPAVLLFLVSVAILIAFLVTSELLADLRRARRPVLIPTEGQRGAQSMSHLPRTSRPTWRNSRLIAEAIRRSAPD